MRFGPWGHVGEKAGATTGLRCVPAEAWPPRPVPPGQSLVAAERLPQRVCHSRQAQTGWLTAPPAPQSGRPALQNRSPSPWAPRGHAFSSRPAVLCSGGKHVLVLTAASALCVGRKLQRLGADASAVPGNGPVTAAGPSSSVRSSEGPDHGPRPALPHQVPPGGRCDSGAALDSAGHLQPRSPTRSWSVPRAGGAGQHQGQGPRGRPPNSVAHGRAGRRTRPSGSCGQGQGGRRAGRGARWSPR